MASSLAPQFTISNAITAGLTAIERARGFLEAATLSEEWMRRMSQRALLLEALDQLFANGRLTLSDLEERFPETNRRTLQRDLRGMLSKGLLREMGAGSTDPNRHYVAVTSYDIEL